jgi:hypothetical protein
VNQYLIQLQNISHKPRKLSIKSLLEQGYVLQQSGQIVEESFQAGLRDSQGIGIEKKKDQHIGRRCGLFRVLNPHVDDSCSILLDRQKKLVE